MVPPRTTVDAVQTLLGANYGVDDNDQLPDLNQYIAMGSSTTDRVAGCNARRAIIDPSVLLSAADLELVERSLSAHYYTKYDPVYTSKGTAGASASFVRGKNEPEPYLSMAVNLDPSGCVNAIMNRLVARCFGAGGG